jgi:hypothetical protein
MTLKTIIESELNKLATSDANLHRLSWDVSAGQLYGEITHADALACAFIVFELRTDRLSGKDSQQLTLTAERLSERLSYLLEPIRTIEIDKETCVIQLRSLPPLKNDDGTTYYELVVRHGAIQLSRYHRAPGEQRQRIPAHVTREVFVRLADDFVAVAEDSG